MTRALLGVVVVVLAAVAAWGWLVADEAILAGVTARTGVVLAAVWVAWPSLLRTSVRSWIITVVAIGLVILRPRAAWVVLPVLFLVLGWRKQPG